MADFTIETAAPNKIQRSGRKPTSDEYTIGTEIYNTFKVGECAFFALPLKAKSILSRLDRLNKYKSTDYEYTTRKDSTMGEIIGGVRSVVEGFRIYRTK